MAVPAALLLAGWGCTRGEAPPPGPVSDLARYHEALEAWRARRHASLTAPDGWTTLVGLRWLEDGTLTLGAAPSSDIILPGRLPPLVGTLHVADSAVRFVASAAVHVEDTGQPALDLELRSDRHGKPTVLELQGVTWRVIDRGGRRALRVKDTLAPARLSFLPLRYFPVDTSFRVVARLEPTPGRSLTVATIVGVEEVYQSPGRLVFNLAGHRYSLIAAREPGDSSYFIMFRDSTAATSTYPAGRFLVVPPADSAGWTVIDFNRAYNPPCAFTAFATCPLPPPGNVLPVSIAAGEQRPAPHGDRVTVAAARP